MTTNKLNKVRVLMAQGENELSRVKESLGIGFHGKVRTICRRAAGFYIGSILELFPKENYGKSFMTNLRGLQKDTEVPFEIRTCAEKLIRHTTKIQIKETEAIECAEMIIAYCKEKAASLLN